MKTIIEDSAKWQAALLGHPAVNDRWKQRAICGWACAAVFFVALIVMTVIASGR